MAVGDYEIAPFVSPVGTEIATIQTRGNDNVLRDKFVSHQADEVAHLQSGLASARPASGTVTGETYLATDTGALSVWNGSAWVVNNTGAGDVVGDDTSTTVQNIVAYSTTGGKNITELTGTQGDVLYHDGTSWAKLAAGTSGHFLKTNGAAANPAWAAAGVTDGDKGDITVSASGATWTIDNSAVTYAKIQNVSATDRLLGRSTAGAGVVQEITCTAAGRALIDDADAAAQRTTLGLGSLATASSVNLATQVTGDLPFANMVQINTDTILGRSAAGVGDITTLTCTAAGRALIDDADATAQRTTLGLGTLATASSVNLATQVTGDLPLANLAQASAASRLLGRGSAAGAGDYQEISLGTGLSMSGTTLSAPAPTFADGTAAAPSITFASDTNTGIFRQAADTVSVTTAGVERVRVQSTGYVHIDSTNSFSSGSFHLLQGNPSSNVLRVFNSATATPSGIYIFFSGAAPDNTSQTFLHCQDNVTNRCFIYSDGDLANHDGTYGTISDERLKQDIIDATSQWNDVKAIRFRKYRMKTDVAEDPNAGYLLGVVAQEIEQTSPGLVKDTVNEDGTTTKVVKSSILLMKAAKALQEAMARIEALETEMAALKAIVTP